MIRKLTTLSLAAGALLLGACNEDSQERVEVA